MVGMLEARMKRFSTTLALSAVTLLVTAQVALAADDHGEGWYGETDDRVVTAFGLGLVVFFTLFVIIASAVQGALDRRKAEKKAAQKRQLAGW